MRRTISIHPLSLAAGVALAAIAFLTMSQAVVQTTRIEYGPHPRDFVQVRQGIPFSVPPGKLFVPTAVGVASGPSAFGRLLVNGQEVGEGFAGTWQNGSMAWIPDGLVFPAGSIVEAQRTTPVGMQDGQVWGYLADDHSSSTSSLPIIRLPFIPPVRDWVCIQGASGFTVPSGKILALTAANVVGNPSTAPTVSVDGVLVFSDGSFYSASDHPSSISRIPIGLTARATSVVTVAQNCQAWAYLVNQ